MDADLTAVLRLGVSSPVPFRGAGGGPRNITVYHYQRTCRLQSHAFPTQCPVVGNHQAQANLGVIVGGVRKAFGKIKTELAKAMVSHTI